MLPPEHTIVAINRKFSSLWQDIDAYRAEHSRSWPGWCFIPRDELVRIMSSYFNTPIDDDDKWEQSVWLKIVSILAPWRVSKSVYKFDPDIYRVLIKTPLRGELPVELFFKLPEWTVYIETPDLDTYFGGKSEGFVASLNYSAKDDGEVRLSLLSFGNEEPFLEWLYLKKGITIEESLAETQERYHSFMSKMQLSHQRERYALKDVLSHGSKLVNLLLYICQVNSEHLDVRSADGNDKVPGNPLPRKTKRGLRYFPPKKPNVWECGMRQGADLRRAISEMSESGYGTHRSPIPHTRAAHWQTYIVGKGSRKDPTKGKRVLKWIHTILVNSSKGDVEVPVIRRVD